LSKGLRPLDVDTPKLDEPLSVAKSDAGALWDLPPEAFTRWWAALPEEDRAEFVGVYGGGIVHARFICALHNLMVMQARPQTGSTIVEAYAIAAGVPANTEEARRGAGLAWEHDAVQALLDRLRYRSKQQAAARIINMLTLSIEEMLQRTRGEDVPTKEKADAARTALQFVRMVSEESIQERVERTKRGFQKAQQALGNTEVETPTDDQAELYLKTLISQIGKDKVKALLSDE
jgi:hypothetical protein